jgi:membrane protease YdiL (CAAX protease family)
VEIIETDINSPLGASFPPPVIPDPVPTPNDPPWNSLTAFAFWVASVLFIIFVPGVLLIGYLGTHEPRISDPDQLVEFAKTDPTSIMLQLVAIIPAHLFTILLAWLIITKNRRYSFRDMLGWKWGGVRWWHFLIILIGFFILTGVVGNYFPEQENDMIRMLESSRSAVFIVAFIATFSAPLVEEVVYRGVLYSAFQRALGVPAAFIIVTLMFSLVHVPQYWPSYPTIFLLTLLSVILTSIRVRTNNLLPCIVMHMIFNGVQSVFLILRPYIEQPELQEKTASFIHFLK